MEALVGGEILDGKLIGRDMDCEVASTMGKNSNLVWVKMGWWDVVWTNDYVTMF